MQKYVILGVLTSWLSYKKLIVQAYYHKTHHVYLLTMQCYTFPGQFKEGALTTSHLYARYVAYVPCPSLSLNSQAEVTGGLAHATTAARCKGD